MVRYWRATFRKHIAEKNGNDSKTKWTFKAFIAFCQQNKSKCKMQDEKWWTQYYSESVMHRKGFHNLDASQQIVFPDRKQLPQLKLTKPSSR